MGKEADAKIMELRKDLLTKKQLLLASDKPVYIAGEYFRPEVTSAGGEFQIAMATQNQLLRGVKAMLFHSTACKTLGVDSLHLGFNVDDWVKDFRTRNAVLERNATLEEVNEIEEELKELLSQAQKREIGIDALESKISGI